MDCKLSEFTSFFCELAFVQTHTNSAKATTFWAPLLKKKKQQRIDVPRRRRLKERQWSWQKRREEKRREKKTSATAHKTREKEKKGNRKRRGGKNKNPKNVVTPPSSIHPSIHPWTPSPRPIHPPSIQSMHVLLTLTFNHPFIHGLLILPLKNSSMASSFYPINIHSHHSSIGFPFLFFFPTLFIHFGLLICTPLLFIHLPIHPSINSSVDSLTLESQT